MSSTNPTASSPSRFRPPRPELLSPAGDAESFRAAVENGANAVYFGLQGGLNARAKAANFTPAKCPH